MRAVAIRASPCASSACGLAPAGRRALAATAAGRAQPPTPPLARRLSHKLRAVEQGSSEGQPDSSEEEAALLPEEDAQIPGGYRDAMSSNTQLGKAIKGACQELDTLGEMEKQVLGEAEQLLQKLGYKGSLFVGQPPQEQQQGSAGGDS